MAEGGSQGTLVSGVAQRYATALFELAEETGAIDTVAAALDSFNGLLAENADLTRLIESPAFTAEEQVAAIKAVLDKAGITGVAANFIGLVASLAGCGVVAFPVRTTSAAVKIVPVAGDVVAAPLDVTADVID